MNQGCKIIYSCWYNTIPIQYTIILYCVIVSIGRAKLMYCNNYWVSNLEDIVLQAWYERK